MYVQSDTKMLATLSDVDSPSRHYAGYANEDGNYHVCVTYKATEAGIVYIDWRQGAEVLLRAI